MAMNSAPLRLAAHGLSRKDLDVLRSLLSLYRHRLSRECQLCAVNEPADLHLIDIDDPVGWASWQMLRNANRCIVFSHDAVEASLLLTKPLRGPALLSVLSEASFQSGQLGTDTVRIARPVFTNDPHLTGTHPALSNPGHGKLLIDFLETGAIDTYVRIATPERGDALWIDPELRQYLLGSKLTELRDFLRAPLQNAQLASVSREEFREHAQQVRPKTLTRLQWFSALACSDGKLIDSVDRSAPVQLTAWPDMEGHSPKFFRLAGLLVKQAVSFDGIVKMTGIDSATTADFVNASYRSGLVRQATARESAGSGSGLRRRGIVSRLRERLGL